MAKQFVSDNNYEVTIEKMVMGGYGLGRLASGQVVLVCGVLPGETVCIKPVRRKKDFQLAVPLAVKKSSSHRIAPPCPYYEQCGGCDLQHISHDRQLAEKRSMLIEHFGHRGPGEILAEQVGEVIASPQQFGYRQRIRLHVEDRSLAIGYHRKNSHQVVDIAACLIADPLLNTVFAGLRQTAQFAMLVRQIKQIALLKDESTSAVTVVCKWRRQLRPAERQELTEMAARIAPLEAILIDDPSGRQTVLPAADERPFLGFSLQFDEPVSCSLRFTVEPGGFTQVNAGVNRALVRTVLDWASTRNSRRVLDLFCGMGNFAIPLSLVAEEVYGVDLQRAAIRAAERNALANDRRNCHFQCGSAGQGAERLLAEGKRFDTVVLDPPRQGCSGVLDTLAPLGAEHLIYISCDPATLSRDIGHLMARQYRIVAIQPFDMFPQTHHLETAVLLAREDTGR